MASSIRRRDTTLSNAHQKNKIYRTKWHVWQNCRIISIFLGGMYTFGWFFGLYSPPRYHSIKRTLAVAQKKSIERRWKMNVRLRHEKWVLIRPDFRQLSYIVCVSNSHNFHCRIEFHWKLYIPQTSSNRIFLRRIWPHPYALDWVKQLLLSNFSMF